MQQIAEALETESKEITMSRETDLLDSITVRQDVFSGKPIIRDMRIAGSCQIASNVTINIVRDDEIPSGHRRSLMCICAYAFMTGTERRRKR